MTTIPRDDVLQVLNDEYRLNGSLTLMDSEWGGTFKLATHHRGEYVVKCAPTHVQPKRVQMEIAALKYIGTQNIDIDLPSVLSTVKGSDLVTVEGHTMRVYSWVNGRMWADVNPHPGDLLHHLGKTLGLLKTYLEGFDHPAAHCQFDWSPHDATWLEAVYESQNIDEDIPEAIAGLVVHKRVVDGLPMGVNFNDANDYNIIVSNEPDNPQVRGFIDFGDLHYGPLVNDLAICIAYAVMGKADPISAACHIIRGYVAVCELREREVGVLLILIKMRLAISIAKANERQLKDPSNTYWQISAAPARKLLSTLTAQSDYWIVTMFRNAAGYEPCPKSNKIEEWLVQNAGEIYPLMGFPLSAEHVHVFDWSVGSLDMGSFDDITDIRSSTERTFSTMAREKVRVGVGRYAEPRAVYTSDAFEIEGDDGIEMRTLHIGFDIFMPANTPLHAPLPGRVIAVCDNGQEKGYGPLVILKHEQNGLEFYTLYGHCSNETLDLLDVGQIVEKGSVIGWIGNDPENGGWVPHCHFQIMTDLLGFEQDFPGVVLYAQRNVWLSLCPDPNLMLGIQHTNLEYREVPVESLIDLRSSLLPSGLSLSHKSPLHIVRGWRTKLYDTHGISYLDTRNNIAHVGHEEPRVVSAIARQAAVLNTNTRYLHQTRLKLAERLLSTLPDRLSKVYFVNSGSEANDLALRIAREALGTKSTIVMDKAYHGHTAATIELSPYKFEASGGFPKPEFLHILPSMRQSSEHAAEKALALLSVEGPCTFLHESLPSCAGQIVPPDDYFKILYDRVRAQGGICIADEVQTGLGRVGSAFWSFQLYGIEPDIVTIGKPLGNGHPIAAVAVSEDLAASFDNGMEYFNSFGGNPVSCAAANAVLDVIEEDQLQIHADSLGSDWMVRLKAAMSKTHVISDIRGFGLFFGVEIGRCDDESSTVVARHIQRRMLDHHIMISLDGPTENVIKIKPPLTINKREVQYFMQVFEKILEEDAVKQCVIPQ